MSKTTIVIVVVLFLLIVWGTLGWFVIEYGEVLQQHPCSICARKIGGDVVCTTQGVFRTYLPNGSYYDIKTKMPLPKEFKINFSLLQVANNTND